MGIYFEETSDTQDSLLLQNKYNSGELQFDESGLFYDNGHDDKFIYWVPLDNGNISIIINGKIQRGILTQSGYYYIQNQLASSSTLNAVL